MKELIQKLKETQNLSKEEWISLIENRSVELSDYLFAQAREVRHQYYGKEIYVRGLIEFTNYCKNDCFYCGIRKSNANTTRYRLTKEDILTCCKSGYTLGFRTFVLQGGEDGYFTDSRLCDIVSSIKSSYPTAPSHFPLVKNLTRAIRHYLKLVQTVIFCAMRHLTPCITKNCIRLL